MKIIKEKNYISIYEEDEKTSKPYVLNVNTGEIIGKRGCILKNKPANYKSIIIRAHKLKGHPSYNVFNVLLNHLDDAPCRLLDRLSMADRLDSIGYINLIEDYELTWSNTDILKSHFKNFVKEYKDNPQLTVDDYCYNIHMQDWYKRHNIEIPPHTDIKILRFVYKYVNSNYWGEIDYSLILWYLNRGLYDLFEDDEETLRTKINNFLMYINYLKVKPTKDDFLRLYSQYQKTYYLEKAQRNDEPLKQQQLKHNLNFEYKDLQVIVPLTSEEFRLEAQMQNNCVYNWYLERVSEGATSVVFIRKKDDLTHSYITCEVNRFGYITQYFHKHNSSQMSQLDDEFRKEYQHYLFENYK